MEGKPEQGLAVRFEPAVITADFEAMNKALDEYLADYDGMTREALMAYSPKELKPLRADLNKRAKELNDAKIAIKKQVLSQYNEFEAELKKLMHRIEEPAGVIDEVIKAKENDEKLEKLKLLEGLFLDFCEANGITNFAACVPFERIMEPSWLNKTTALGKAERELESKLQNALKDYRTIEEGTWYDRDSALQCFFETLSVSEAMRRDLANKEAAELREALRAEVEGNRQGYTSTSETAPQNGSEGRRYRFEVECTVEQHLALVGWLRGNGIAVRFEAI